MGGFCNVDSIESKGCKKLFLASSSSSTPYCRRSEPSVPMSLSNGPFSGLVICVTGLSKEARKQVMEATESLGGQYSPNLHPRCTHLVVQSCGGCKFEHAVKHGARNGLLVVTLGWFVDSVGRNVRMSESLYAVKIVGGNGARADELNRVGGSENACFPRSMHETKQFDAVEKPHLKFSGKDFATNRDLTLSGHSIYVDSDISDELRNKVLNAASYEGAKFVDKWFIGCSASHVVCEGASVQRYLGHSNNIVTPLWVLKTVKEKYMQRLVHISPDLARQVRLMLENHQNGGIPEEICRENILQDDPIFKSKAAQEERQEIVYIAKNGVRKRRNPRMQTCQNPIRPITPNSLMENICWTISEPTPTASVFTDSLSTSDDIIEHHRSALFEAKGNCNGLEASFANSTKPLTESEKTEVIFKNHFLTIFFPIDRFSEMGPYSKTYFSNNGFTCLQILDYIYAFYQENMSGHEIEVAIHTDSRHADRLRTAYCCKESAEHGFLNFKRIEFLGSRKSFEMLKRVSGDNNGNVYELVIRA